METTFTLRAGYHEWNLFREDGERFELITSIGGVDDYIFDSELTKEEQYNAVDSIAYDIAYNEERLEDYSKEEKDLIFKVIKETLLDYYSPMFGE